MAKPSTCPRCGQLIPPDNPFFGSPVKGRIYRYVAKHPEGVTCEQVMDAAYADDPDGGPSGATNLYAHVHQMNRILRPHGLSISSTRGRGALYRLAKL